MAETEYTCAVWWWRYHAPLFELFETEEQAARFAVGVDNSGDGSVAGVQFADGRMVEVDSWDAYDAENRRVMAQWDREREERRHAPPVAMRTIRVPFSNLDEAMRVPVADTPDWVGVPDDRG